VRKGHHFSARCHRNGSRKAVASAPLAPSAEWGQAALHIGRPLIQSNAQKTGPQRTMPVRPHWFRN